MAATYDDMVKAAQLLRKAASDADGIAAARELRALVTRTCGLSFAEIRQFCRNNWSRDDCKQFTGLKNQVIRIWQSDDSAAAATTDPGPDYTWVPDHERKARSGKVTKILGHWRHTPRKKSDPDPWRHDRDATPGDGYRWIEGHERHHAHNEVAKSVQVRGHWRRIPIRKAPNSQGLQAAEPQRRAIISSIMGANSIMMR